MHPDNELFSKYFTAYITNDDGTKTELGEIKTLNMSIDLAVEGSDKTIYSLCSYECSGSFSFKTINKNIFRQLTDKSYCKYLKRVNNRNKLYNKLKKKGRKL